MAKNGLDKWFKQQWVDIGSKKKDGSFSKCGRSKQKKDAKRKYPKCVPLAKARRMTEGQRLFDRMLSKKKEDYEKKKYFKGGRVGLRGGGLCKRGMNREAIGKNS